MCETGLWRCSHGDLVRCLRTEIAGFEDMAHSPVGGWGDYCATALLWCSRVALSCSPNFINAVTEYKAKLHVREQCHGLCITFESVKEPSLMEQSMR